MLRNEMKELQFVKIERAGGEEFIHRGHYCNEHNEFHATMMLPEAHYRYG
jgi:hypothetical protein